jgi:hypothetical protein
VATTTELTNWFNAEKIANAATLAAMQGQIDQLSARLAALEAGGRPTLLSDTAAAELSDGLAAIGTGLGSININIGSGGPIPDDGDPDDGDVEPPVTGRYWNQLPLGANPNFAEYQVKLFGATSPAYRDISTAPVAADSATVVNFVAQNNWRKLKPDFGFEWEGVPAGIPITVVDGSTCRKVTPSSIEYAEHSYTGPIPLPNVLLIEGVPQGGYNDVGGDRHMIILDRENGLLYELFAVYKDVLNDTIKCGSVAKFDTKIDDRWFHNYTSADASGYAIAPLLIHPKEILNGEINHATRAIFFQTRKGYVDPARHWAAVAREGGLTSDVNDPRLPPMGSRFRLNPDRFDISTLPQEARTIARAWQKYGMITVDNGSSCFFSGVADLSLDQGQIDAMHEVGRIPFTAFDMIQPTSDMMVDYYAEGQKWMNEQTRW